MLPYRGRCVRVVKNFFIAISFASSVSVAAAQQGEFVILSGGDRISGMLLEVTRNSVVFSTSHSGVVEISRTSVERLNSTRPMTVLLNSGERLIGRIVSLETGKIRISSQSLGDHTIGLSQVATITPAVETADAEFEINSRQNKLSLSRAGALSVASQADVRGKGKDGSSPSGAAVSPDTKPTVGAKPIVQRPEDKEDIRDLFPRQASVLLSPGQYELEGGLLYQRTRVDSTVLNTMNRGLSIPLGLRVGLADRWQGFANVQLAYGYQQFSFADDESSLHHAGVGDVSAGLNYQVLRERDGWPDIVASAGFSAPTGRSPYADDGSGVALGTGHWSSNMGLQFIKTVEPVAIFGGLRYTYQFARDGLGKRIKPGNALGYSLGLIFAINDRVSVNGEFIGSVQEATREDGARMVGSAREPMQFRTGLVYRVSKNWYLAPTVTYSLNSDAPDVVIGVSTLHRFQ